MTEAFVAPEVADYRNNPVWKKIDSPGFAAVLARIGRKLAEPFPHGYGWKQPALDALLTKFKRFFYLKLTADGQTFPPTLDVDVVWHFVMQCPRFYYDFCMEAVGYIPDHNFDFGMNSDEERKQAQEAARRYALTYKALFGEPLPALPLPICVQAEYVQAIQIACGDGRVMDITPRDVGGITSLVVDLG